MVVHAWRLVVVLVVALVALVPGYLCKPVPTSARLGFGAATECGQWLHPAGALQGQSTLVLVRYDSVSVSLLLLIPRERVLLAASRPERPKALAHKRTLLLQADALNGRTLARLSARRSGECLSVAKRTPAILGAQRFSSEVYLVPRDLARHPSSGGTSGIHRNRRGIFGSNIYVRKINDNSRLPMHKSRQAWASRPCTEVPGYVHY